MLLLHNADNNNKLTDGVENEEFTQDEIDILKYTMSDQTNSISNKEALKDKIHEIHNYLRNNGAGYGMNALKVFNILYGLKQIEENRLLETKIGKRGGGLGSRTIFKKINEPYAPS